MVSDTTFRDMTLEDIGGGLRLCRAAGWNQLEDDWRALLAPPSVFRLALRDDRAIGAAGAVAYGGKLAWVCMVLVDPAERGHGLGTAVVEQVLERLAGFTTVGLDATPSGRPVYARLGFADAYGLARFERSPSARRRTPAEKAGTSHSVRPLVEGDLPAVLAWDRDVFGADRARVLRRHLAAAPECALVVEEPGELVGYCLGRPGHRAGQIGPLVARDRTVARALVSRVLASRPGKRFYLDAPHEPEWRSDLQELGFVEQRPFTRMYRGNAVAPGLREPLYAIVGPEFG
jgi:GNAT superfamily N-acetyltransferase